MNQLNPNERKQNQAIGNEINCHQMKYIGNKRKYIAIKMKSNERK